MCNIFICQRSYIVTEISKVLKVRYLSSHFLMVPPLLIRVLGDVGALCYIEIQCKQDSQRSPSNFPGGSQGCVNVGQI